MKRVMCVRLPEWPIQRARRGLNEPDDGRELLLYEQAGRASARIMACSAGVRRCGVRPGMPLGEAISLAAATAGRAEQKGGGSLAPPRVELHDPSADRAALEELAVWTNQRFSPTVGLLEDPLPAGLWLDVTGCEKLFDGEPSLVRQAALGFQRRGLRACLALADTLGAAWALAQSLRPGDEPRIAAAGCTEAELRALPAAALRLPAPTLALLDQLGIETVEQILLLPRASLPSRLGRELAVRLDQALGHVHELTVPYRPPIPLQVAWTFEFPTARREPLEATCERLLERVVAELESRRQGVIELACRFHSECPAAAPLRVPGSPVGAGKFVLRLLEPSIQLRHLRELMQLELDRLRLSGPVSEIVLCVLQSGPLQWRQRELFQTEATDAHSREFAGLVDRLSARLGPESVSRVRSVSDAQPEEAYRLVPAVNQQRRKRDAPARRTKTGKRAQATAATNTVGDRPRGLRPLRLLRPQPVVALSVAPDGPPLGFRHGGQEHRVIHWRGPERIETGWWRGPRIARDYFIVETSAGCRAWLFRGRRDGRWYLHGWFD